MTQPHIIAMAKFTGDLLEYNEDLIDFDRTNTQQGDLNTSYIVVDDSSIANKLSSGRKFNDVDEIMNYNESWSQQITLEFYGDEAYTNARNFSLLCASQAAYEIKDRLGLTVSHVSQSTDVKKLLGTEYGNRIHLTMSVKYNPSIDVDVLRIDTAQFEFLEDK